MNESREYFPLQIGIGVRGRDAPLTVTRDLGLTLCSSIVLLVGLSLVLFGRYDLTRERCTEVQKLLKERRTA